MGYNWVNSIISGRNPPLCCTLTTLITMQGNQNIIEAKSHVLNKKKFSSCLISGSGIGEAKLENVPILFDINIILIAA